MAVVEDIGSERRVKELRPDTRSRRRGLDIAQGEVVAIIGRERLRQEHAAALHQRSGADQAGTIHVDGQPVATGH